MSPDNQRIERPDAEGRVLLDEEGRVVETDRMVYEAFGVPEDERDLSVLDARLEMLGLRPAPDAPSAFFHRVSLFGKWEDVVETAFCRAPGGGWTVAVKLLRDADVKRGGYQSLAAFLANTAHELQTPLTSLKASLQLLDKKGDDLPANLRSLLQVALRNVNRIIRLVQNIVDSMKISSGSLELRSDDLDPAGVMLEAVQLASSRTAGRHVVVAPGEEGLPSVRADRSRIVQVLGELLENAAKCSKAGTTIEISATAAPEDEVTFAVRDEGVGLAPEHAEAVFSPFFQVDGSATREVQGLGLGLSICRGIVEGLGGRIWVEAEPGRGSSFFVSLPSGSRRPRRAS